MFVEFREQISLKVRSRLLVWSFQPAKQALKDLPIFTFADMMRFPTATLIRRYPDRYFKFLIRFWKFQKNMRCKSWSSLTMIYPRPLILWYYYLLFWWAEYCGALPELLKHPDRSLIPELFIRYIVKIDSIIDRKGGKEYLFKDIPFIKRDCTDILKELLAQIWESEGVFHRKQICDQIWKFRQNSLIASRKDQNLPELSFDDLLDYKDKTAGELFRVWVNLLCDIYHVKSHVENSIKIFGLVAMAIQVIDDMLDSPVDYREGVSNIFIHILKETVHEFEFAKAHFERNTYDYLDWTCANKYLPNTCKKAVDCITCYIKEISILSENPIMTTELCAMIEEWRVLNPKRQVETEHEGSSTDGGLSPVTHLPS